MMFDVNIIYLIGPKAITISSLHWYEYCFIPLNDCFQPK